MRHKVRHNPALASFSRSQGALAARQRFHLRCESIGTQLRSWGTHMELHEVGSAVDPQGGGKVRHEVRHKQACCQRCTLCAAQHAGRWHVLRWWCLACTANARLRLAWCVLCLPVTSAGSVGTIIAFCKSDTNRPTASAALSVLPSMVGVGTSSDGAASPTKSRTKISKLGTSCAALSWLKRVQQACLSECTAYYAELSR